MTTTQQYVLARHDLQAIDTALSTAESDASGDRPTVIIAKTVKGRGFSEVEDSPDWHGKPLPPDKADRATHELGGERALVLRGPGPPGCSTAIRSSRSTPQRWSRQRRPPAAAS